MRSVENVDQGFSQTTPAGKKRKIEIPSIPEVLRRFGLLDPRNIPLPAPSGHDDL